VTADQQNAGNPFGLLPIDTPDRESGLGLCDKSPNTRHLWNSLGIGAQSCEVSECRHCHQRSYD
jgi:hypothetical protein